MAVIRTESIDHATMGCRVYSSMSIAQALSRLKQQANGEMVLTIPDVLSRAASLLTYACNMYMTTCSACMCARCLLFRLYMLLTIRVLMLPMTVQQTIL